MLDGDGAGSVLQCVAFEIFELVDHEHELQRDVSSGLEFEFNWYGVECWCIVVQGFEVSTR